ncbi:CPBP family intramembrane metalloprotease [Candidatus Babeliales bacterium]|nr:CPBP family intramembrane metalloprotease [Candidatus Babeliales bacterium]
MQKKQWIVFALVVGAFGLFAYKYFDQAIPFIKVPITMNYDQACQQARDIIKKNKWNFSDYQVVAKYTDSAKLQAFVELEGGGKTAFIEMIEKDYFQPYAWHVRLFKEKEVQELIIAFTPSGKPYEFAMKLPETLVGNFLEKKQAHEIALQGAESWNVDLTLYELVESNCEELPSGRIDYTFMYERHDVTLQKGLYRIKLKVSGDIFSQMQREVKIPDEFHRRYEQMFSLNHTIAGFARNIGFIIYFFIFGLFIFVFFFHRKNGFLWKAAFKFLAFLMILFLMSAINDWSLIWNQYPTHIPIFTFMIEKIVKIAFSIIFLLTLIGCSMLFSEVAGRAVFLKHIQFFKLWNCSVLATYQVLTQTLLGYGFAIIMMGYAVAFALCTQTLGWWVPLSNLMDPNILATKVPSFSPIVQAFRAGFMEEILCRALPLAGMALLVLNSKHKKYWIAAIFFVQAIIFGALHANYPQQPAYYRIVELIFHSTGSGLLYLYFGLLPGIVAHFLFDAFLMSLPIFASTLFVHKILSIFMMLIPLILVFVAWVLQEYRLKNVSTSDLNKSLEIEQGSLNSVVLKRRVSEPISTRSRRAGYIFGLFGLLLWSQSTDFEIQTSKIMVTISEVENIARQTVEQFFGPLGVEWKISRNYLSPKDSLGGKFIWQVFGNDAYQTLQGNYLASPSYSIKFCKFEGPVEDRSETFEVFVQADGTIVQLKHAIPEFWSGADLCEEQAQDIVYDWIAKLYKIDRNDTQLVVSQSTKHQDRRDWNIVVKDVKNYVYDQGQGRIQAQLCGDQLSLIMRFIQPTEQWQRDEQSRMTQDHLLKIVLTVIAILFVTIFLLMSIRRFGIATSYFLPFLLLTFGFVVFGFAMLANNWFEILFHFNTAQPFSYQIFNLLGNSFIKFLVKGASSALLVLSIIFFGMRVRLKNIYSAMPLGVALGVGMFGLVIFLKNFEPMLAPNSGYNGFTTDIFPIFGIFSIFIVQTVSTVAIMTSVFAVSEQCAHRRWLQMLIFVVAGIVLSSFEQLLNVPVWIFSGILVGLVLNWLYQHFLRYDSDLIWIIMATGQIMHVVPSILYGAFPDIVSQFAVAILLFFAMLMWIYAKF